MSDEDDPTDRDEDEGEDHGPFEAWLLRGIADDSFRWLPRYTGAAVPDRDPTAASPWLPRGPGNIAGRVRTLAVDPPVSDPAAIGAQPRAIYAGAASGGVFRSRDQGRSWESVWENSKPSPSIGAIAIGVAPPAAANAGERTVWVATGEKNKLPGAGVWRAVLPANADLPIGWTQAGTLEQMAGPGAASGDFPVYIDAAAVDPDDPGVCWFAGPSGVYRCKESPPGTFTWSRFRISTPVGAVPNAGTRKGPGAADVKFISSAQGRYVLIACLDSSWGDILLVTRPDDAPADIQMSLNAATVAAPAARAQLASPLLPATPPIPTAVPCKNARLAIVPDPGGDRVYVVYATTRATKPKEPARALCVGGVRAAGAPAAPAWVASQAWTIRHQLGGATNDLGDAQQDQGTYNLTLAATRASAPAVPGAATDVVACGLVDVFVSSNGGTSFTKSLDWRRYDRGDLGQHADQHALIFARDPGPRPTLWVANDGGIATTGDYLTAAGAPAPAAQSAWRRRIAGLVIGQTYDVSQSTALPDVCGVALQDIGAWVSGGSSTWRHVHGGDGLGLGFDPHDPHHLVASWQGEDDTLRGSDDVRFGGSVGLLNDSYQDPQPPLRPRRFRRARFRGVVPGRVLAKGLAPGDSGTFEDLVLHPTQPGRMLHIRRRRLYTSTDGEAWTPVMVGDRFELVLQLAVPRPAAPAPPLLLAGVIVTVGGSAARKLGFLPGETSELRPTTGAALTDDPTYLVRITSAAPRPEVAAGDRLELVIEVLTGGAAPPARFLRTIGVDFPDATQDFTQILTRLRLSLHGPLPAGGWSPAAGPGVLALPAGVTVEAHALPAFAGDPTFVEIIGEQEGGSLTVSPASGAATPAAAAALLVERRTYDAATDRHAVVTLLTPYRSFPDDPAPSPVKAGDELTIKPTVGVTDGPVLTYTWAADATHAIGTPINPFYAWARPLAAALDAATPHPPPPGAGLAPTPSLRVWPIEVTKWVRLRSGRQNAAAFQPFTVVQPSSALAGLTESSPIGSQVLVDFKPKRHNRYNLTPAGGGGGSSRLIIDDGTRYDIDFDPARFGGSLANVTVEEVRDVIDRALNHDVILPATDIVVEVQRQVDVLSPLEVAFSPHDPRVIWVGALNHVYVTTDGGATLRDLFPPPAPPPAAGDLNFANFLWIEAIAPDPFPPADPDRPVYTALVGVRGNGWVPLYRCSTDPAQAPVALTGLKVPAPYAGAPDQPLRVYAVEGDPARRHTYYAATEIGVFRTTDDGDHWEPFSTGLPHCPTLDLALDHATDTLRVAVFGRGVFERKLGDGAGLPPVYVRGNQRDAGRRPVAHGADLDGDTSMWVDATSSPDIRLTSRTDASVAALDAVELDELPSERLRPDTRYHLVVRVNNRTPLPVGDARVLALWADAGNALPPLPASFWTALGDHRLAAGDPHGAWHVLGDADVLPIAAGDARTVSIPAIWATDAATHVNPLDHIDRVALLAITTRSNAPIAGAPADAARLVLHDARVGVRLAEVRAADTGAITLRAIVPATGTVLGVEFKAFTVTAPSPTFTPPGGAPLPAPVVRSTTVGPFNVAHGSLRIDITEHHLPDAGATSSALAALDRSITINFDDAHFAAPGAVPAAELRAYLAQRLAQETRLVRVDDPGVALAVRRTPADAGPRVGGASWQSGELVVTAVGTAAGDGDFSLLSLARSATTAVGAPRRFSVRIWNRGDDDAAATDVTVRFFWLDPHADVPAATQLGADQHVAVASGQSAIAFVEEPIGPVSHDDVLILAEVDHPGDRAPPRAFATWADVLAWATTGDNTIARTFRRMTP